MQPLSKNEYVVTAYAEPANGPGWTNQPLWIVIRNRLDNTVRIEAIQPMEQTADMRCLYGVSAHVHSRLTDAVQAWLQASR